MRRWHGALTAVILATAGPNTAGQAPAPPGPTFDVVSVRQHTQQDLGSQVDERLDGSITLMNMPVMTLISRAYPGTAPVDMVGLPPWSADRYDIQTTASLQRPTPEQRLAMMRALLADRFKLAVHVEPRPQQVYRLVRARDTGPLGPRLTLIKEDCEAVTATRRVVAEADRAAGKPPARALPDPSRPLPPCTGVRMTGPRMEGDVTLDGLATLLRAGARRRVVNRTGLKGSYHIVLEYDPLAALRGPDVTPPAEAGPSVFTAVQEQLGLKLEPATEDIETLVVDHIERPADN